jgi:hypothetical protein
MKTVMLHSSALLAVAVSAGGTHRVHRPSNNQISPRMTRIGLEARLYTLLQKLSS